MPCGGNCSTSVVGGRPFPLFGGALLGPSALVPLDIHNRSYTMQELTPLYIGQAVVRVACRACPNHQALCPNHRALVAPKPPSVGCAQTTECCDQTAKGCYCCCCRANANTIGSD